MGRFVALLVLCACSTGSATSTSVSDASCASLDLSCAVASGVAPACVSIAAATNQTLCSLALAAVQGGADGPPPPTTPPGGCIALQQCCAQIVVGVDRTTCDLVVTEDYSSPCWSALATLQEMGFCPSPPPPDSGA